MCRHTHSHRSKTVRLKWCTAVERTAYGVCIQAHIHGGWAMKMDTRDKIRARPRQIKPFHRTEWRFILFHCVAVLLLCRFIALIELLRVCAQPSSRTSLPLYVCAFFSFHFILSLLSGALLHSLLLCIILDTWIVYRFFSFFLFVFPFPFRSICSSFLLPFFRNFSRNGEHCANKM